MSSVRKRTWSNARGEKMTAWLLDYRDAAGVRRAKQFRTKREAEAFETNARYAVSQGTHTPDSQSITVAKAASQWIGRGERENLEPATLAAYRQHVQLHIVPFLGAKRLNALSKPMIEDFRDQLLDAGRSRAMAKRVLRSLSAIVAEAERKGFVAQNVCRGVTVRRMGREKPRVQIPTKAELRTMIEAAAGLRPIDKPMIMTLVFTGLRASELRALPWRCVDFVRNEIRVEQRADRSNHIGPPKTAAGFRTIPIPAQLVAELKAWKLRCPRSALDLVFPSEAGTPMFHPAQVHGFLEPVQIAAGVTTPRLGADGKPMLDDAGVELVEGRYTLHCLRHAAASLWIEQRVDAKRVQRWMGHSSIQVTFDTYGHLFEAVERETMVTAAIADAVLGRRDATRTQHRRKKVNVSKAS